MGHIVPGNTGIHRKKLTRNSEEEKVTKYKGKCLRLGFIIFMLFSMDTSVFFRGAISLPKSLIFPNI